MVVYVNLVLAWVTVVLAALCTVIWVLRLIHKRWFPRRKNALYRVNRLLRHPHKWLGLSMVVTGGIHGLLASDPLIGWNLGTLCWMLCILAGLSYALRIYFRRRPWMVWHRIAVAAMVCMLTAHILHTGIQIDDLLWRDREAQAANIDLSSMIEEYNQSAVTDTGPTETGEPSSPIETGEPPSSLWKDGVYTGEGTGFNPGLQVQATIEGGLIAAIEIVEHDERNERYYSRPMDLIPQQIVDAQSTDVDTVTGATRTSMGIIEAVEDALAQASG